ncbi:unnamed protein product, partial [Amoebophrya sp. A120]
WKQLHALEIAPDVQVQNRTPPASRTPPSNPARPKGKPHAHSGPVPQPGGANNVGVTHAVPSAVAVVPVPKATNLQVQPPPSKPAAAQPTVPVSSSTPVASSSP